MTTNIDGIKKNLLDEADQLYRKGYLQCQKDMVERGDKTYENGLEAMRHSLLTWLYVPTSEKIAIFGKVLLEDILRKHTADEFVEKVKEWEQKQQQDNEIKVGDEVIDDDNRKGIAVRDTYYIGGDKEAFTLIWYGWYIASKPVLVIKKTGKHIDGIAEVLKQMQEG